MRKLLLLALFIGASISLHAQNNTVITDSVILDSSIYVIVETNPVFPGGIEKMYQFIGMEIQYPEEARNNEAQGRVYVSFVVEMNGELSNIKILKDLVGYGCGEEAIRVIKLMPNWTPGYQRRQVKRVQYNLPIVFKLGVN